ncbi:MAG: hypothetical protein A2X25_02595 [Chloroflexi bacterium GWB2_49_20]|nr:MAG: hypothetical protein A2X25_02595 [Chloroflexi bacterium GWB2_49_20]OGN77383.1 MAG: hypothetical protein A2X26_13180 [Chloroflexi bacterium GWC2_49_37]OGN85774.1 MAG: hypothetical protein A2X27_01125 [Chloroflexi bacterium GWD2_49_16]HBG73945.1 hypothetical protein [Anaerolineae bacterium]HCC78289.1 hypothetical protein [Anaerolineae bacterium]
MQPFPADRSCRMDVYGYNVEIVPKNVQLESMYTCMFGRINPFRTAIARIAVNVESAASRSFTF